LVSDISTVKQGRETAACGHQAAQGITGPFAQKKIPKNKRKDLIQLKVSQK